MRLSDGSGPTSSVPGSPGQRGRWTRKKTFAAALTLTAVTGLAGLAQANVASAATLGKVTVDVSVADANSWAAGWGKAWDLCRSYYPGTKSLSLDQVGYVYASGKSEPVGASQIWSCRSAS